MRLLTLAAAAGLFLGLRHFLAWREAPAPLVKRSVGPGSSVANQLREQLPESIDVTFRSGVVTLRGGPLPQADMDRCLATVLAAPGVQEVDNYVQVA